MFAGLDGVLDHGSLTVLASLFSSCAIYQLPPRRFAPFMYRDHASSCCHNTRSCRGPVNSQVSLVFRIFNMFLRSIYVHQLWIPHHQCDL